VCCSVLQYLTVCCSPRYTQYPYSVNKRRIWECDAVCCSVLQCIAVCYSVLLQYVVVRCSVLQCVAVCCSLLQSEVHTVSVLSRQETCMGVCCSVLQ